MKVFISWSGDASRDVALALADWLPKVIQGIQPFVSAKDIDKGANWAAELARELRDAEFGIVCLTPENLISPWLNYEAGAITKSVDSRVCPVLLGVEKAEVGAPLAQLQLTNLERNDFAHLLASVNKEAGDVLDRPQLEETLDVWWPKLEEAISKIEIPKMPATVAATSPEPERPTSDIGEMLTEVLQRVRDVDRRLVALESFEVRGGATASEIARNEIRHFVNVVEGFGFAVPKWRSKVGQIVLFIHGDLPGSLPADLFLTCSQFALKHETQVVLEAFNRTATFDRNGSTQEPLDV